MMNPIRFIVSTAPEKVYMKMPHASLPLDGGGERAGLFPEHDLGAARILGGDAHDLLAIRTRKLRHLSTAGRTSSLALLISSWTG